MRILRLLVVVLLAHLPLFESWSWSGLASLDPENFLCANFDEFCTTILDDLGCDSASSWSVDGCPNYPQITNNITHYSGVCECSSPYLISAGDSVLRQLVFNRIRNDVGWMMQVKEREWFIDRKRLLFNRVGA